MWCGRVVHHPVRFVKQKVHCVLDIYLLVFYSFHNLVYNLISALECPALYACNVKCKKFLKVRRDLFSSLQCFREMPLMMGSVFVFISLFRTSFNKVS